MAQYIIIVKQGYPCNERRRFRLVSENMSNLHGHNYIKHNETATAQVHRYTEIDRRFENDARY